MFITRIEQRHQAIHSNLCIGLDPNVDYIQNTVGLDNVYQFNKQVVDATHQYALCYKPQIAHYNALGLERELAQTIAYIHSAYPDIPVILDAKRGDIGSTADHYVKEAFERYDADAVTVNPYLGSDSITPFTSFDNGSKGVIILAKTSNPSADMPQTLLVSDAKKDNGNREPLYIHLAKTLDTLYSDNHNLLFVVGGTDVKALQNMREACPHRWFLVPGVGSQGGTMTSVMAAGKDKLIVNVTRGILYPKPMDDKVNGHYFVDIAKIAQSFYEAGKTI